MSANARNSLEKLAIRLAEIQKAGTQFSETDARTLRIYLEGGRAAAASCIDLIQQLTAAPALVPPAPPSPEQIKPEQIKPEQVKPEQIKSRIFRTERASKTGCSPREFFLTPSPAFPAAASLKKRWSRPILPVVPATRLCICMDRLRFLSARYGRGHQELWRLSATEKAERHHALSVWRWLFSNSF